ncbi:MAG: rod shape-determining protein MreC [Spirochaetia bacterium]|nr:rod shape-determining protein MreC [Spirochaetota bacterium]MCX8097000.1 rod shape-determining protein MreC [Spirochaetota bacterium]MDW8111917.1 rod shape-determining protein MreC [Spirochaetia bacterium]
MDVKRAKYTSPFLVYAIVLSISIVLLIFTSITHYVNLSIKFVGNVILTPIILLSNVSSQALTSLSSSWTSFTRSIERIRELEEENEKLKKKSALVDYYETENKRLSIMLNVVQSLPYKVEVANIISSGFDSAEETIVVDKGMANGIVKNMPVIAYFMGNIALVGIVKEVYLTSSVIETILSPNINVGVMLESSQEVGILYGNGKLNGTSSVKYISDNINVRVGSERIFTFSKSLKYPGGILVGTVILSKKRERSRYQEVVVKPAIDIKNISSVMIIKER